MKTKIINCFECEGVDCESVYSISVCKNAKKCYTMTLFKSDGTRSGIRGCIFDRDHVPYYCYSRMNLRHNTKGGLYYTDCCDANMCNNEMFRSTYPAKINNHTNAILSSKFENKLSSYLEIAAALLVSLMLLKCFYTHIWLPLTKWWLSNPGSTTRSPTRAPSNTCVVRLEDEARHVQMQQHVSPPNNPMPMIAPRKESAEPRHRTLAQQIKITECIGSGHFGRELWRGVHNEEQVVVKAFRSHGRESLFYRETKVYMKLLTKRHEHLVNYIGSDTIKSDCNNYVQHWLVVQYYPHGSLYNFLLSRPLTYKEMFDLCLSLSKGLLYLHTEVVGSHGKLSLAHRNLTSKNIMVKANGVCAIGELGWAVSQEMLDRHCVDLEEGSKRYMSPELLARTINGKQLEDFFCSDVYSAGLIFWEICRCCSNAEIGLDYAPPYFEWLESKKQPDLQIMRKLVLEDELRPTIPNAWQHDPKLNHIGDMIKECWYAKPASRLTALRIKKTLTKLAKQKSKNKVVVLKE